MANFSKSFNFRNGVQVDNDKFIVKPVTGLVGIGSTAPTQVLDVAGNIKADGVVNSANVEVGTGITVGAGAKQISIDGVTGLITAVSYFGDGSTLTNVVAIATAGFEERSGTLSTTFSVGIGSLNTGSGGVFPDFTLDVLGNMRVNAGATINQLNITGVSTFAGVIDVNNSLDVVGGSTIDNLNVTGISTFVGVSTFVGLTTSTSTFFTNQLSASGISTLRRTVIDGALTSYGSATFGESGGTRGNNKNFSIIGDNRQFLISRANDAILFHLNDNNGQAQSYLGTNLQVAGISTFSSTINVGIPTGTGGAGIGVTITDFGGSGQASFSGIVTAGQLNVDGHTELDNVNVSGVLSATSLSQLNVTGVSTLTGRVIATEINSASSNVVRLLQDGVQVFNTIGAGVSVSNTLKIGSLNGGTSGLSALSGLLRYGNESGSAPYSTRRSLDLINNDSGNINFYLNANNLSVPVGGSNFIWHKGFNNDRLMTLTNTGNLGIGETQPNTALHVNGISTVTGNSFVAGNFYGKQNLEIGGDADVVGDLSVTGNFTLNTTLSANVAGNVTGNLSGSINDIGISTFANIAIGTYYPADGIELDGSEIRASFQTVGIGTTNPECGVDFANAGASVGDRFMIPPTVTTTERNGIGETANGGLIFNSTANRLEVFIGGGWVGIATTT